MSLKNDLPEQVVIRQINGELIMCPKNELPEQVVITYVDHKKHKRSHTALYTRGVHIYIVDEVSETSEVLRFSVNGITYTGLKTRDVVGSQEYTRCGLGTTITITQE